MSPFHFNEFKVGPPVNNKNKHNLGHKTKENDGIEKRQKVPEATTYWGQLHLALVKFVCELYQIFANSGKAYRTLAELEPSCLFVNLFWKF
jgi:hypothetical protein